MKKKVTIEKKIEFPTMIGEISAISLEHHLSFIDESHVEGDLLLTGRYKMTEASRLEEDFEYKIPTEIVLTEKINLDDAQIDITDFSYEVVDEDTMICHIELFIQGLDFLESNDYQKMEAIDSEKAERECDGDDIETKEMEIPRKDFEERQEKESEEDFSTNQNSLFMNLKEEQETYGTFIVYMVRQNETVNTIIEKYSTTVEELEKYNELTNLNNGTKLIIPVQNEK